jgi:hypothetical protein
MQLLSVVQAKYCAEPFRGRLFSPQSPPPAVAKMQLIDDTERFTAPSAEQTAIRDRFASRYWE